MSSSHALSPEEQHVQQNQANRDLAAATPQAGESNRIADQESAVPGAVTHLTPEQIEHVWRLQADVKTLLPEVPLGTAGAIEKAMAEIDSQFASNAPNAFEIVSSLGLIATAIEQSMRTADSYQVSDAIRRFLTTDRLESQVN